MIGGSVQLRQYRCLRRDGASQIEAALLAGISLGEAKLVDADDARQPPPPEAFELLEISRDDARSAQSRDDARPAQLPSAREGAPQADAGAAAHELDAGEPGASANPDRSGRSSPAEQREHQHERTVTVGRQKKAPAQVEEVPTPDFELALRIYRQDIKPAISNQATHAQEASEGYKAIDKRANVNRQIAKFVFKLMETEESTRDVMLRDLSGMLGAAGLFKPVDLVDVAEGRGETGQPVVPTLADNQSKPRGRPKLVTIPTGPEADDLLNSAADEAKAEAAE